MPRILDKGKYLSNPKLFEKLQRIKAIYEHYGGNFTIVKTQDLKSLSLAMHKTEHWEQNPRINSQSPSSYTTNWNLNKKVVLGFNHRLALTAQGELNQTFKLNATNLYQFKAEVFSLRNPSKSHFKTLQLNLSQPWFLI